MGTPRDRLDRLTRRWRERHDARLVAGDRPRASGGREALARRHFPYREQTPQQYADAHGADMIGFTYDEESYADADLDVWVLELGRILREGRAAPPSKPASRPKPKPKAKAKPPTDG